jgi:hypothetical protein
MAPPPSQSAIDDPAEVRLVERALCRRTGCCVASLEDAGTDRKGRALVVARTVLDGTDCLLPRPRARRLSKKRDTSTESDDSCRVLAHDLVIIAEKKVSERYTLSSECENGGPINYHRIDDQIEVDSKAHTFTHSHSNAKGGLIWGSGLTIGLDPVRLIDWDQSGGGKDLEINWDLLRRRDSWSSPDEEARAQLKAAPRPDAGEEEQDEEDDGPTIEWSTIAVPKLELPRAFTAGGWKTTGLGSCGVLIDGAQTGYTLHGEANAGDATLRVVAASDGVLFVEVTDDLWTGPSRSWVKDDHLELWLARDPSRSDADPGKAKGTAVQWGIRIADGATFSAFGGPERLKGVEVVRQGPVARVKIPFPPAGDDESFAVVYSDGDDGKTQERLIATSPLKRGDGGRLVGVWEVNPDDATCAIKAGALTVVRPHPPKGSLVGRDLEEYLR